MTWGILTHGMVKGPPVIELLALLPESSTSLKSRPHTMTVAFTSEVTGDTVVNLSSDDPAVFSVPASVTVLDGEATADFDGDPLTVGSANIEASLGAIQVYALVTVEELPFTFGDDLEVTVEEIHELDVELG